MQNYPKISIITPTFNAAKTLRHCIESIVTQNYTNIEYWLIDGLSTDNTVAIIEEYASKYPFIKYISEKDSGVYDAMNKGINLANGEWLYFLGADDRLVSENVLERIFMQNNDYEADFIVGNILIQSTNKYINYSQVKFDTWFCISENVGHQALFTHQNTFHKVGKFDTSYKLSADNRFFYQALRAGANYRYIDVDIAYFAGTGISSLSKFQYIAINEKIKTIKQIYLDSSVADRHLFASYIRKYLQENALPAVLAYAMPINDIMKQLAMIDSRYIDIITDLLNDEEFLKENSTESGGYEHIYRGNIKIGLSQIWTICKKDEKYTYHFKNILYWLSNRVKLLLP